MEHSVSKPQAPALIYVFAFPFAGGNTDIFKRFEREFPVGIEWVPVNPDLFSVGDVFDIAEVARNATEFIQNKTQGASFILLGYSMGGLIAYEIAQQLDQCMSKQLICVKIFACHSPNRTPIQWNEMSIQQIADAISGSNDTNSMYLSRSVLTANIMQIRRHLLACAKYTRDGIKGRITAPLLVTGFSQDSIADPVSMGSWKELAERTFVHKTFRGGHFALFNSADENLVSIAMRDIKNVLFQHQHQHQ